MDIRIVGRSQVLTVEFGSGRANAMTKKVWKIRSTEEDSWVLREEQTADVSEDQDINENIFNEEENEDIDGLSVDTSG